MKVRVPGIGRLRALGFPFVAPSWPGTVDRPPVERTTGVDFDTDWARKYPTRLARAVVLDTVGKAGIGVLAAPRITGDDRLVDVEGPVVFAANHASHVDTPLLLTALPDRFRHRTVVAAGADYFFDKRWKGYLWAFAINAIPIERTRPSTKSLRLAAQMLDEGWSLIIFPEGGRSPHGWAQEHRPGAAFLASRAGVAVVPVHLEGTRRILRKGANRLTPSTTHVTFGHPLVAGPGEDAREFAVRVEDAVAALADEQATDWWTARRRAAAGTTPPLRGPDAAAWRRSWSLGEGRRAAKPRAERWPNR
ncbi:MAG TPA: lysophospholipid acyltransferase family protein [Acidimicrobiales bacterium]|nr:lysophospholipid acyltransferase family protein [Acidimicrobiales bacterium]